MHDPTHAEVVPVSGWLTLTRAAESYPFSRRTLWRLIATGRLRAYRPTPAKVLVRRSDLDGLILAASVTPTRRAAR